MAALARLALFRLCRHWPWPLRRPGMHHRRGRDAGGRAASGGVHAWVGSRPAAARVALLALSAAFFLACWAASWVGELVFPTTVQQAALWKPRTAAAAAALVGAPQSAQSVELVISRFSGNLSWVAGVVALLNVDKVTVYCKARARVVASQGGGVPRRRCEDAP